MYSITFSGIVRMRTERLSDWERMGTINVAFMQQNMRNVRIKRWLVTVIPFLSFLDACHLCVKMSVSEINLSRMSLCSFFILGLD